MMELKDTKEELWKHGHIFGNRVSNCWFFFLILSIFFLHSMFCFIYVILLFSFNVCCSLRSFAQDENYGLAEQSLSCVAGINESYIETRNLIIDKHSRKINLPGFLGQTELVYFAVSRRCLNSSCFKTNYWKKWNDNTEKQGEIVSRTYYCI